MGKVSRIVSRPFKASVDLVKNVVKGDVGGAVNSAVNVVSMGTLGITGGGLINIAEQPKSDASSDVSGAAKTAVDTLASEAESTAKKRKSLYFTEGEELGQDTTRVFNTQKRGSIFS